jgi:hypothetical protein
VDKYLRWHAEPSQKHGAKIHGFGEELCEGFGIAYRLKGSPSVRLKQFCDFFSSDEFFAALARRFDIDLTVTTKDSGLQKYLDGYEISPHPDIRKKALTFMVNVNTSPDSSTSNHHTHYMTFKPEWRYISEYWKGNPYSERTWVPWDWC